jgi:hypothetical protein
MANAAQADAFLAAMQPVAALSMNVAAPSQHASITRINCVTCRRRTLIYSILNFWFTFTQLDLTAVSSPSFGCLTQGRGLFNGFDTSLLLFQPFCLLLFVVQSDSSSFFFLRSLGHLLIRPKTLLPQQDLICLPFLRIFNRSG